jgi:3-deoxy-D-manno-octulosonate 8-phosphate phosphatase (KDO 8-P phosphatase)
VDGVLTDGQIIYTAEGHEIKSFSVRDGLGIRLAMDAGIRVGIVTARASEALRHRCRNLGIDLIFDGVQDKGAALDAIVEQTGIPARQTAFVGDDLLDLPLMRRVGVAAAVADADDMVLEYADLVTRRAGGQGAVREVCELLLKARGEWAHIRRRFGGDEEQGS